MTVASAPCELLQWDSDFFGFPVARVRGSELDRDSAAAVDAWCTERGVRCVYLLLDADDNESARAADANGYELVDVRLTLRHDLDGLPEADPEASIRQAEPRDISRSQRARRPEPPRQPLLRDGGFSRERCDALYARWVADAGRDPDRWVGVREVAGTAVGYQVVRPPGEDRDRGDGDPGRGRVAPARGHRPESPPAGLRWGRSVGAVAVETATQERNGVSYETHLALGFSCTRREAWRHKWFAR